MPTSLADFLRRLAEDPVLLEALKQDPDSVLASSGLSAEDQEILRSRDVERIKQAIGDDAVGMLAGITLP